MNTVKCPKCGSENLSTNIRCENCGTQLITEEQTQNIDDLNLLLNTQFSSIHEAKIYALLEILSGIGGIIGGLIFSAFSSMFIFNGADTITKVVGIPFFICGLAIIINGISMIVKGINTKKNIDDYVNGRLMSDKVEKKEKKFENMKHFAHYIYIFVFFLYWFGLLILSDIFAIQSWSDDGKSMFFFSLGCWNLCIHQKNQE